MRLSFFSSLRSRLLLLVLLAVLPALGLVFYADIEQRRQATAEAQEEALRLAHLAANNRSQLIAEAHHFLTILAQLPQVRTSLTAAGPEQAPACQTLLADLSKQYPLYTNLGVINPDGDLVCSDLSLDRPLNLADRPYFQRALDTAAFVIGDYQIGRLTGKATLHFAYPLLDEMGRVQGVVFAGLDLTWLNRLAASLDLPPGATLMVIDRQGTILAHQPDPEEWVGRFLPEASLLQAILSQGEGAAELSGVDGVPRLYAFTPLFALNEAAGGDQPGGYVSIGIPAEVAFAEVNQALIRHLVGLGLVGLLALAAAWFGGDLFILRQVRALVKATRQLSTGDLAARTGLANGGSELTRLAMAFDEMAGALQRREQERRQVELELQDKIRQVEATHQQSLRWAQELQLEVAERQQAQKALQASEERFRLLVEGVKDYAMLMLDPQGHVASWNAGAERLHGYTAPEVIGQHFSCFHTDEDKAAGKVEQLLEAAIQQGYVEDQGWRVRRDGSRFWGDVALTALYDNAGQLQGFAKVTHDTSERRQAEARMATQFAVTRILVEAPGLEEATPRLLRTICQGLNWQFGELWQLDPAANLLCWSGFWHEPARGLAEFGAASWARTYASGAGLPGQIWADGQPLWITDIRVEPAFRRVELAAQAGLHSAAGVPVHSETKLTGVMLFFSQAARPADDSLLTVLADLGSQIGLFIGRKQAEAQVQQERAMLARRVEERTMDLSMANAELARTARLKDEFLANMSHELRTPLNAILGLSEALQEQIAGPLNERQLKYLGTIEESGRHLLALINDILDLSKIEAGKLDLQFEEVPAEQVCQASLQFIKQTALKKGITVSFNPSQSQPLLRADTRRLKQILVNLLTNAVKFTPEKGQVGLDVVAEPGLETLRFVVWDTGLGITPENLSKLFKPFVQLDSSLTRQHEGTGLGLALVARLVEYHGGSISVESQPGRGSRFTVALPWSGQVENQVEPAPGEATAAVTAFHQALVIEDSPSAAEQMVRYLEQLGLQATFRPAGEGAVEAVLKAQADLVLLDLQLAKMSGWEVLSQLKTDPRTASIPVIIVSVVDEQSRGLELGATDYLVKPISRPLLQAALSRAAQQQAERPATAGLVKTRPAASKPVILLAEDNEVNIRMTVDYLADRGYHVIVARNGLEAVSRAKEEQPALILMDIQMPGLDGLEATRRIRAEAALATTPIIALTALAMPGDRERCLAAGANDYLSKPVNLSNLVSLIKGYLKKDE
jgi:PAS domain S-box-containing protein